MGAVQKNEFRFRAMGTEFLFRIYADPDLAEACEAVAGLAIRKVRDLEDELSEFKPSSRVGEINLSETGVPVTLTPDFCKLFEKAIELKKRTLSSFNPFIKSLGAIKDTDYDYSPKELIFTKKSTHLKLSFGAIGKGYALDEVAVLFHDANFSSFVISAGGSSLIRSQVSGLPGEEEIFWVLGKTVTDGKEEFQGTYLPSERSVLEKSISYSVSAEYERGKHILGRAPRIDLMATLVADESACASDALATAFFVAGWAGVAKWGNKTAFMSIDEEKIPMWNQAATQCFQIPSEWTAS